MSDPMFDAALAIVRNIEGLRSNDPRDPGGDTVEGISRKYHPGIPWPPTPDQIVQIYRTEYYDRHRCGEMPWPWALAVFDGCVNPSDNIPVAAQIALGVFPDGKIGPVTLAAMAKVSPAAFDDFIGRRALAYTRSAGFATYGHGWLTRLARIAREAAQGIPKGDAS